MPLFFGVARRRAPLIAVVVTTTCLMLGGSNAFAAKGGKTGGSPGTPGGGLSLTSDYVHNTPNTAAPTWCMNEDDYHKRMWTGSVNGSFTATEQLCGTDADYSNGMYWNAGGIGLQSDLWVTGTLSDLTITSPAGDSHHAVLVGSSTSKGVTTEHYQVCYVPHYSIRSNTGGSPLPGGTWQITVSGDVTKATFAVTGAMTDVNFQQGYCPTSEQNLS